LAVLALRRLLLLATALRRPLRPFPTRRSSDLGRAGLRTPGPGRGHRVSGGAPDRGARRGVRTGGRGGTGGAGRAAGSARGADARSEEHTSELQSRFDLVCRLLLEKKKGDCTAR